MRLISHWLRRLFSPKRKMPVKNSAKDEDCTFSKTPEKTPEKKKQSSTYICDFCKKEYEDPRVLPCLHCFCLRCLEKLNFDQNHCSTTTEESLREVLQGYYIKENTAKREYQRLKKVKDASEPEDADMKIPPGPLILVCPTCGYDNEVPLNGVSEFPPHYLLQHRMLIKSLNEDEICLLCDLCPPEIPATSRCTTCLLNLCNHCSDAHKRENLFPDHELTKLEKDGQDGLGITKIRRQAMCPAHLEKLLTIYCYSCGLVICTECHVGFHSKHECESSSRAAAKFKAIMKDDIGRINSLLCDLSTANTWNAVIEEIEVRYDQVLNQIEMHLQAQMDRLKMHRKSLIKEAGKLRLDQIRTVQIHHEGVKKNAKEMEYVMNFGEQLLSEGSDFEVLTFGGNVLHHLRGCFKTETDAVGPALNGCVGSMQFLPKELAGTVSNFPIYGVVTTQDVSPSRCYITVEGLRSLNWCRENRKCELTLVTADINDERLVHGSEGIEVLLTSRAGSLRQIPITIVDRQNGIYDICFTPESPGKMWLYVSIRGIQIKDSPFLVSVRPRIPPPELVFASACQCFNYIFRKGNKKSLRV